ncbi:MAG: DUF924 family protein [Gammaproteobacteria bacterium]
MRAEAILDFWFADVGDNPERLSERSSLWFMPDADTDALIKRDYEDWVLQAERGQLNEWADTEQGKLALIILLDQFPRNIYRGTADAFRCDALALALSNGLCATDLPRDLNPVETVFALMPYEHSEDLRMQRHCVSQFDCLQASVPQNWRVAISDFREFAVSHCEIIERFGRFPHRNEVLGRAPTDAEQDYLAAGGETFGQSG